MTHLSTRLAPNAYLAHLRAESARFREVLADCDPTARVPSCPDWDAAALLWHLAIVQRHWAQTLAARPEKPDVTEPTRPEAYADLLAAFDVWSADLAGAFEGVDPSEAAWNWSDDHTVGFILRRQAHEALIHRVDAELTAGLASDLDPLLATDGVDEVLGVMYGACPPWGVWEPGEGVVRVDTTDTGEQVWVRLGTFSGTSPDSGTTYTDEADLHVVPAPEEDVEPDVVVDGPAAALDLWLWRRGDDSEVSVAGDPETYARFRAVVDTPID
ncbi:maleylpyruvate isomerase family mycothiol-dependent enzyme [Nocardioides flavus (ex Wang et al. 2016)]|uniref:maleylpyruvate isomerase family mycothiol-dependent enzyme n=1 Tax=Nocardioides flavus (ex Wang et al. 2016) TaxID=2058780 RepID=UPI001E4F4FA8|nr:maleylpyruvate isomerase family mycothiol-dependent enzyme [Nocardioides flavus (ex Wang et al. 2016)]